MIKRAYNIALTDRYDLKSQKDMLKILEIVDPVNANEENAGLLSKILQLFSRKLENMFQTKQKVIKKIIN